MPLTKCSVNGASGWRWGSKGHCYTGPDGKKQAIKQALAIEGPDKFKAIQEGHSKGELDPVLKEIISDPTSTLDEISCAASLYQGQPLDKIIINEIIKNKRGDN